MSEKGQDKQVARAEQAGGRAAGEGVGAVVGGAGGGGPCRPPQVVKIT